jgi:Ca2+-binding RTX toxin-like protein
VDTSYGGPGRDVMLALAKADADTPGGDTLFGGRGNDVIRVSDGEADSVDCGRGRRDRVISDPGRLDHVTRCEIIVIRPPREESDDAEVNQ